MRNKKTMWIIIILGLILFIFLEGLTFTRFGQKILEGTFFSHLLNQYEESMKKAKEIPDSEFLLSEGKIYLKLSADLGDPFSKYLFGIAPTLVGGEQVYSFSDIQAKAKEEKDGFLSTSVSFHHPTIVDLKKDISRTENGIIFPGSKIYAVPGLYSTVEEISFSFTKIRIFFFFLFLIFLIITLGIGIKKSFLESSFFYPEEA